MTIVIPFEIGQAMKIVAEWKRTNKDMIRLAKREEYQKTWRKKNREKLREYARKWHKEHPDYARAYYNTHKEQQKKANQKYRESKQLFSTPPEKPLPTEGNRPPPPPPVPEMEME